MTDTVLMARKLHPGQRNNLDALCKRYSVDNSNRELHGALLDARLLAGVYLAMTGGQSALTLERQDAASPAAQAQGWSATAEQGPLVVVRADETELAAHWARLRSIAKKAGKLLWQDDLPVQAKTGESA